MPLTDLTRQILSIGREVNPGTAKATRDLLAPHALKLNPAEVKVERDVHYGRNDRQRMDVFTPANKAEPERPLLIFVHGGGFVAGDKHSEGSPFFSNIGQWAVQNGYNCIAMTYRLAPVDQWPSGIEDIHQVMRYLRHEGSEHGVDTDSIFLMGQSAGAAHASSYVAHPEIYAPFGHGLTGLILLSGVYNYTSMKVGNLERSYIGDDFTFYEARSSLKGLINSTLPMLICQAENDPPMFEQQGLELLTEFQRKHQHLPPLVYAMGQNHMSVAMSLGIEGDLLGPQLKSFMDELGRYR